MCTAIYSDDHCIQDVHKIQLSLEGSFMKNSGF